MDNPCDFSAYDWLYVISAKHTMQAYGVDIKSILGEEVNVVDVTWGRYGGDAKIIVDSSVGRVYVHQKDLSYEDTYQPPFPKEMPEYYREIANMRLSTGDNYRCRWVMYTDVRGRGWSRGPLDQKYAAVQRMYKELRSLPGASDPCHGCWERECDGDYDCRQRLEFIDNRATINKRIASFNPCAETSNTACWASVMRQWGEIYERFNRHPTHLLAKFDLGFIDYPEGPDSREMTWMDVVNYVKYMKQGAVLPKYFIGPTMDDHGKDWYCDFRLGRISRERLFWYLCTVRNIAEKPGIVKLTNHFVEKAKMQPLMAYVMGHVCLPNFTGGHSAIFDANDMRSPVGSIGQPLPDMEKVLPYVVKCHKFLTRKIGPYVTEDNSFTRWNLADTTKRVPTTFETPKDTTIKTATAFDIRSRMIKESV